MATFNDATFHPALTALASTISSPIKKKAPD